MKKGKDIVYGNVFYDEKDKKEYPLCNLRNGLEKGFYKEIAKVVLRLLEDINSKRILAMLFTLTFPQKFAGDRSETIKQFVRDFPILLRRAHIQFRFIWVEEHSQRDGLHLHLFLIVTGNQFKSFFNLWLLTIYIWHGKLKIPTHFGFVHYNREKPFIYGDAGPDHDTKLAKMFQWGSYVAKVSTKEIDAYGCPIWGSSALKNRKRNR